jgi:hypothetical protein
VQRSHQQQGQASPASVWQRIMKEKRVSNPLEQLGVSDEQRRVESDGIDRDVIEYEGSLKAGKQRGLVGDTESPTAAGPLEQGLRCWLVLKPQQQTERRPKKVRPCPERATQHLTLYMLSHFLGIDLSR